MSISCNLRAICGFTPQTILTNTDISHIVDTSDQWITERTGIRQRRKLDADQNASDLGLAASREALRKAGLRAADLSHVLGATCTPDYLSPSISCIISGKLHTDNIMAFDIGAACSGFIYGLYLCRALLAADCQSRILFVCAEAMTRRLNWRDRSTCVLFGDAAAATVVDANPDGALCSLLDVICKSDGGQHELILVGGGTACRYQEGDKVDGGFFITMQGRDTYRHAVRQMVNVCQKILRRNGLGVEDIDLLVPHQANMRIIEAVGSRLKIPAEKVFANVADYGNTSAASIPLALSEALERGLIRPGATVLLTAFGGGLTWGAALLRFEK